MSKPTQRPRHPRPLRIGGRIRGECDLLEVSCEVPIPSSFRHLPREWRRAAAWLRHVADWWDGMASENDKKKGAGDER